MGVELRLPNINAPTTDGKVEQIRSYLYQFIEQLQWALKNIDTANTTVVVQAARSTAPTTKAADPHTTFDAIKPLIIKSAEVIDAYYGEIYKRLEGYYVAHSDFGTFKEQTVQDIHSTSTEVEQFFSDLQEIETDIDNLNFAISEVNARIKSGVLYYDEDEIPVFGIEIGQTTNIDGEEVFNKFARFTSDRLSFYDQNDSEVAYISDYKLYITHVEIIGTAKFGAFLWDTTHGIRIKWVGRG